MIRLKDLLLEAIVMDMDMADELATRISKEVDAPFINVQISTLGGRARPSVMLKISLDPKGTWVNNIYHNSRYSMWSINYDGTMEQFSSARFSKNFRKARFKTSDEVIKKLNTYIKQVQ